MPDNTENTHLHPKVGRYSVEKYFADNNISWEYNHNPNLGYVLPFLGLTLVTGLVLSACAPADGTPSSESYTGLDGDANTNAPDTIVDLDDPNEVVKLLTATPDFGGLPTPSIISPAEIASYNANQHILLDEYPIIPPPGLIPEGEPGSSIGEESAQTLKRMGFVPVSVGGAEFIGNAGENIEMIPLPSMSSENGDILTLDAEASVEGNWFVYRGIDVNGQEILRYSPKSVECSGECATAIWFGEGENAGTTLIFDLDPTSGKVNGVAQAFYTSMDDKVTFEPFDVSQWAADITGADAIAFAIEDGAEMALDTESGTVSFTSLDNKVRWAEIDDYHYMEGFGSFVEVTEEDGRINKYIGMEGTFVKSERIVSPTDAPVFTAGERVFVEKDGLLLWVDAYQVDPANGEISMTLDEQELKWDGKDWMVVPEEFDLSVWAGTDQVKLDFVQNMKEWKVDPDSYTCGEGGKCLDLEGNVIFEDGKYELHFAQQAIANSGVLGGPQVTPGAGGRIKHTDVSKLHVEAGLAYEVLENDLMDNSDIQLIPDGKTGVFNYILLDPNLNLWGYVVGYHDQNSPDDEKSYKYLSFIEKDGKTVDWIQINPSSAADIINYWASQG